MGLVALLPEWDNVLSDMGIFLRFFRLSFIILNSCIYMLLPGRASEKLRGPNRSVNGLKRIRDRFAKEQLGGFYRASGLRRSRNKEAYRS